MNFDFTYSTSSSDGGSSVLLYSQNHTSEDAAGSSSYKATLTAEGTFSFGGGFGFNLIDGITVTAQSSGSGTLEYESIATSEMALPDLSVPTGWWGWYRQPEQRHEIKVTTSGSFAADVTLSMGLFGGLSVDATYSMSSDTVARQAHRTDWVYWETDDSGVLTYREDGYGTITDTVTHHFSGNETDGFDESVTTSWDIEGDVSHVGTKHEGPPPEVVDDSWTSTETILDGIQLTLDIGGMVPFLGEPLDAVNAGISLGRGNYGDAAMSIAAMVPIGGQAVTGAKLTVKAGNAIAKNLDKADEAVGALVGLSDEFSNAVKQSQNLNQNMAKIELPLKCPDGSPKCFTAGHRIIVLGDAEITEQADAGIELDRQDNSEVQRSCPSPRNWS